MSVRISIAGSLNRRKGFVKEFGYGSAAAVAALVACVVRGRALSRRQRITRSAERARAVLHDHTTPQPFYATKQIFKIL